MGKHKRGIKSSSYYPPPGKPKDRDICHGKVRTSVPCYSVQKKSEPRWQISLDPDQYFPPFQGNTGPDPASALAALLLLLLTLQTAAVPAGFDCSAVSEIPLADCRVLVAQ
jgi:hypothetical protein